MHFGGERLPFATQGKDLDYIWSKEPFSHLTKIQAVESDQQIETNYRVGTVCTDYYAMPFGGTTYLAEGPDNPSNATIPFYIERSVAEKVRFVHVLASYEKGQKVVQGVDFTENKDVLSVNIRKGKETETIEFPIGFSHEE